MPLVKYNLNSKSILHKTHFLDIYKLDINKKIITIFLSKFMWIWRKNECPMTEQNYLITNKLNNLINFLSKKYNVILRIHPSNIAIKDRLLIYNKKKLFDISKTYNFNCINDIENLYSNFNLIDNNHGKEVYKYTDYGITFNGLSSVNEFLYLYNIPLLLIDNKTKKWENHFENVEILGGCTTKINTRVLRETHLYGNVYYDNDLEKNDTNLYNAVDQFLSFEHIKTYKYFKNNPVYDNEYYTNYSDVVSVLINKIVEIN
jgi:hypothetical protein